MATVKGDVHDIGKNIVGVVLGCNNYEVIDLGVMVPADKILEVAREKKVDLIGLSGLITPSLDEMVHVASEMEREGFRVPLLIGGATTSRAHTARQDRASAIASRWCTCSTPRAPSAWSPALKSAEQRAAFVDENRHEQERAREQYRGPQRRAACSPTTKRAAASRAIDWSELPAARAVFHWRAHLGVRAARRTGAVHRLDALLPRLGAEGHLPAHLGRRDGGPARQRAASTTRGNCWNEIVAEKSLTARAVAGLFPANSVGDDIELYADATRTTPLATFYTLRQQMEKPEGESEYALADFIAPKETGLEDYLGAFAVTAGIGADGPGRALRKSSTTTTTPSWPRPWPTASPKPAPNGCTSRSRDAWGFGQERKSERRKTCSTSAIAAFGPRRAIPPRPTTPKRRLCSTCSTPEARHGHPAHGKFRHAAGGVGLRPLFLASRSRAISPWARSAATRCSTISAAKAWTCAPSNAGWAPT